VKECNKVTKTGEASSQGKEAIRGTGNVHNWESKERTKNFLTKREPEEVAGRGGKGTSSEVEKETLIIHKS